MIHNSNASRIANNRSDRRSYRSMAPRFGSQRQSRGGLTKNKNDCVESRGKRLSHVLIVATVAGAGVISACSAGTKISQSSGYSKRVVNYGDPVPRGGGRYKLGAPYVIKGRQYVPRHQPDYDEIGIASWYGDAFHGRLTANGEIYDMDRMTAAHPTLPLPSFARVTNLKNGRSLIVRVNDRGPYAHGRIIDLSRKSAELLQMKRAGTTKVRVEYLQRAPLNGDDYVERRYAEKLRNQSSPSLLRLWPW